MSNTVSLDKIFKGSETWKTEALRAAIKRHEEWIAEIANKVGIKLSTAN